jgi:hypothetical protein
MINRLKIGITTVLILVFAIYSIGAVAAASNSCNVYVNVNGSNIHGNGTQANPYATIQEGINKAPVNGTVYVAPGTYRGKGNSILKVEKNLTIIGYSSEKTIQDGGNVNESFIIYPHVNATIKNFTLRNFDQELGGAITDLGNLTLINVKLVGDTATNESIYTNKVRFYPTSLKGTLTPINVTYSGFKKSTGGKPAGWNAHELTTFSHNESNYSFLVCGDSRNDMGNLASMINVANKQNALFTVFLGDMRAKTDHLYAFKKIYLPPSPYTHFNMPILFSIGNHEEYDYEKDTTKGAKATYDCIFGNESWYSWTEKNAYFIVLDNNNGSSPGNLPIAEYNWLKDQLKNSNGYKYTFIFMHSPLYTPEDQLPPHSMQVNDTNTTIGATTIKKLFNSYPNITMVFTSHIHNYYTGKWGTTPFIIYGDSGAPSYLGMTNGTVTNPSHRDFIKVTVTNKKVTFTVVSYPAVANNYDFTTPPL